MRSFWFGLIACVFTSAAFAADQAYVISWGYQSRLNRPNKSHTFATYFLVRNGSATEKVTISWLPAPGHFGGLTGLQVPSLRAVPGNNYSLGQTLGFAAALGEPVSRFGPYEISLPLYDAAKRQVAHLQSGRVDYKMLDRFTRPAAVNCIHAASDIAGFVDTGTLRGDDASSYLISHYRRSGHLFGQRADETLYAAVRDWLTR